MSTRGLEGTTLQRIADEAGITRSNLAYFIGSRDDIVDATFAQGIQDFVVDMKARVSGLDPPERLPAFIESLLDPTAEIPRSAAMLNALSAAAEYDEHARAVLSKGLREVDAWVREMVDDRYPQAPAVLRRAVGDSLPLILRGFDRERRLGGELAGNERRRSLATATDALLGVLGPPADG